LVVSTQSAWFDHTNQFSGSAIGNRREAIEALDFAARGLVKCHYKLEKMENLSQVCIIQTDISLEARLTYHIYRCLTIWLLARFRDGWYLKSSDFF
jgi:hypothetical protein